MSKAGQTKGGGLWARLMGFATDESGPDLLTNAPESTPTLPGSSEPPDSLTTPPLDTAPPQAAARCPACGSPRSRPTNYCEDCGYLFPANFPMFEASHDSEPAIETAPVTEMKVRLDGRYEMGSLIRESQGVERFHGLDFNADPPVPVIILRSALPEIVEALPVDTTPVADTLDECELIPNFDVTIPVAAVADDQRGAHWPNILWEKSILEKHHPSLPVLLDSFVEANVEYVVMEAPRGVSLWDAWDDPENQDAQIRYGWLKEIAGGLQTLHESGAVLEGLHADLIVIVPGEGDEGGGAKSTRAVIADITDLLPFPLTDEARVKGTLYTAPELILSPREVDARADLYSFGALLYSLEYLHHSLEEKDFEQPYTPKQITDRFPDVHPLLPRLLNKTFVRDVHSRFPTDEAGKIDPTGMTELIQTLEICQRQLDHVRLDIAAWTTTGMVRTGNEDAVALLHAVDSRQNEVSECALVLLADGMGGYEAGEVAAALAIQELKTFLLREPLFALLAGSEGPSEAPTEEYRQKLEAALRHANKEVHTAARTPGKGRRGMGCTAEAVYINSKRVVVGHVGDSRTYHLHHGRLTQLTRDQTLVNRLVELGQISEEEAVDHPRKNELQQALGGQPDVKPGLYDARLVRGDWVIVCSDGLSNHITSKELETMLTREAPGSADDAARRLINLVNLRGATDNATIVLIRAS